MTVKLQIILASLFIFFVSQAQAVVEPTPPKIKAKAYILVDYHSGKVIAEVNADQSVEPASLTKMMSVYVIDHELDSNRISLNDMVRISTKAWKMPGSRMFVEVNSKVKVKDLMQGIIVQSGNDATVAMAEYVAGRDDSFVSLMNSYAKKLGMTHTHFANATGLPNKDHYTTARDLSKLVEAIIKEYPDHYAWYSEKVFTYNGIKQYNRNKLLWRDKYVDGVKTGHTESAGFCLVASAVKSDMRLISVVLGTNSENARATESQKLLTFGFRFYETHKLYQAKQKLTTAKVWKGATDFLPLGLSKDLWVTIPRGQYKNLKASMSIDPKIIAPVKQGMVYGSVNLDLDGDAFESRDLISLQAIPEGGFFSGLVDDVKMMMQ